MSVPGAPDGEDRIEVLLAEDEESFVDALLVGLEREGFSVTVARDGAEALRLFEASPPDLVLLDVMLPKMSGLDVCRAIRARSNVPIIMVTAKSTEIDTVVGLEVGADDYVAKPYRLRELVSRMRAVLRRTPRELSVTGPVATVPPVALPASEPPSTVLEVGDVRLDPERHECTVRGADVQLPLKEFELLEALLNSAGRVVTRDALIDRVWGLDYVGDTKTLDVHVKRLRSRIEADPSKPALITTIRGLGYRFESPRRR
ncbi:MAG TPA: response regulator transcription factor [Acidimicrobiales bacterium]|nr:response regulator transcription factor [Acidimicrobiales bacterium]